MGVETFFLGFAVSTVFWGILTLLYVMRNRMKNAQGDEDEDAKISVLAKSKRMPEERQTQSEESAENSGTQKRKSVEVAEPPSLKNIYDKADELDQEEPQRRLTDSELDKICESASLDENNAPDSPQMDFHSWERLPEELAADRSRPSLVTRAQSRATQLILDLDEVLPAVLGRNGITWSERLGSYHGKKGSPTLTPRTPKEETSTSTTLTTDDSEAVFEDWKVQLDEILESLHSLEKHVKGRKAKKRFKETIIDLVEVRDHVAKEVDVLGQMKDFLLNIQDDEEVQEDEREVAKWLTTSFMNSGEVDHSWAAAAADIQKKVSPARTFCSEPLSPPMPALGDGILRRFGSEKFTLPRSMSEASSLNLQLQNTVRTPDEDEKTLEKNTEAEYSLLKFHQTDSNILQLLEKLGSWEFDIFDVEDECGELMLPLLGVTICKKLKGHKLKNIIELPERTVFDYLLAITRSYHPRSKVSYHNVLHAADVMCSSYSLMLSSKFDNFNYLQIVALILAAAAHDVDHDGFNNNFHINSGSKLALKYNDRSVLENHHCSVGWKLAMLPQHNVVMALPREQRNNFRNIFISSILATDMTGHGNQLKGLSDLHGMETITKPNDQMRLLGHVLHSADISNVSKPFDYANAWVQLVMSEFFKQGDKEKDLNLPVSPLCDRQKTDVDASEVGFIKFVVKPWFESFKMVIPDRCADTLKYLNMNYKTFKDRALKTQEMKNTSRQSLTRKSVLLNATDMTSHLNPSKPRAPRSFTDDDIEFKSSKSGFLKRANTISSPRGTPPLLRSLPTTIHSPSESPPVSPTTIQSVNKKLRESDV